MMNMNLVIQFTIYFLSSITYVAEKEIEIE